MAEVPISQLKQAIRGLHGCEPSYIEKVRVEEDFEGQRVWQGDVYVFALQDHPTVAKCYAWTQPIEGSNRRRFVAVLHEPPVDSPQEAVRAALVQQQRENAS